MVLETFSGIQNEKLLDSVKYCLENGMKPALEQFLSDAWLISFEKEDKQLPIESTENLLEFLNQAFPEGSDQDLGISELPGLPIFLGRIRLKVKIPKVFFSQKDSSVFSNPVLQKWYGEEKDWTYQEKMKFASEIVAKVNQELETAGDAEIVAKINEIYPADRTVDGDRKKHLNENVTLTEFNHLNWVIPFSIVLVFLIGIIISIIVYKRWKKSKSP